MGRIFFFFRSATPWPPSDTSDPPQLPSRSDTPWPTSNNSGATCRTTRLELLNDILHFNGSSSGSQLDFVALSLKERTGRSESGYDELLGDYTKTQTAEAQIVINYLLWDRGEAGLSLGSVALAARPPVRVPSGLSGEAGLSLDQPQSEHATAAAGAEFRYRGYDSLRLDLKTEEVLEAFLDADNVAVRTTNTAKTQYRDHETLVFRGSSDLAITASAALGGPGVIGGTGGSSASAADQAGRADSQREGHWPTSGQWHQRTPTEPVSPMVLSVGGNIRLKNGQLITDEFSGPYGRHWTLRLEAVTPTRRHPRQAASTFRKAAATRAICDSGASSTG